MTLCENGMKLKTLFKGQMPFIKLNHDDVETLISVLEEQIDPLTERESQVLDKLRLIEHAQTVAYNAKQRVNPQFSKADLREIDNSLG
jgi:hypothetical protein